MKAHKVIQADKEVVQKVALILKYIKNLPKDFSIKKAKLSKTDKLLLLYLNKFL